MRRRTVVQRLAQSALPIALSLGIACGSAQTPTEIVDEGEPQPGAGSTIVFQDDFESYDGTCLSMDLGGPWNTSSGTCDSNPNGVISSPNGPVTPAM